MLNTQVTGGSKIEIYSTNTWFVSKVLTFNDDNICIEFIEFDNKGNGRWYPKTSNLIAPYGTHKNAKNIIVDIINE